MLKASTGRTFCTMPKSTSQISPLWTSGFTSRFWIVSQPLRFMIVLFLIKHLKEGGSGSPQKTGFFKPLHQFSLLLNGKALDGGFDFYDRAHIFKIAVRTFFSIRNGNRGIPPVIQNSHRPVLARPIGFCNFPTFARTAILSTRMKNYFACLLLGASVLLSACTSPSSSRSTAPSAPATAAPRIAAPPPGASSNWPVNAPHIYADSAILLDARTGEVLYQKNADSPRQVASTQKLVTALIVAERDPLDSVISIAPSDRMVEPTKLYLRTGDRCTRRELLAAMMVKSANDAAAALARSHSGSSQAFAEEMTDYAHSLGATHSLFRNPHGLPAPQYSTARDMARIAYRAYRNPTLRSYMCLPSYHFELLNGKSRNLTATNKLLKRSPIYNGMKTGYTNAAGRCLITSASMGGRDLILVQLGSKTKYIFDDAERMIQWGMNRNGDSFLTAGPRMEDAAGFQQPAM